MVVRSISTGEGKTEYTPIGHTANLASRIQTLANPNSTVISEDTRKLVEGCFTLKTLGASPVKGIPDAVPIFEVTGIGSLRTRLQRSASQCCRIEYKRTFQRSIRCTQTFVGRGSTI